MKPPTRATSGICASLHVWVPALFLSCWFSANASPSNLPDFSSTPVTNSPGTNVAKSFGPFGDLPNATNSIVTNQSAKQLSTPDKAKFLRKTKTNAEKGNPDAQFMLGFMLENGIEVPKDLTEAAKWYRQAAEQGDCNSQWNLGFLYVRGDGVDKDPTEAAKWLSKAAEKRDADIQNDLGWMFATGDGVPKDWSTAEKWLTKAAERGNLQAANRLACHYEIGEGEKGVAEALKWFRFAAERGDISAQTSLGLYYRLGGFLPAPIEGDTSSHDAARDLAQAAQWYKRAAMQGNGGAQLFLGEMYGEGKGVMQDFAEAYKWFNIASGSRDPRPTNFVFTPLPANATAEEKGERAKWVRMASLTTAERAQGEREGLIQQMTATQIAEGQRRSSAFVLRKELADPLGIEAKSERAELDSHPPIALSTGTGFFVTTNGYLVTSFHVVENATRFEVRSKSDHFTATLVKSDLANDVAILKVSTRSRALPIAASRDAHLGDPVFTIGFPNVDLQGFEPKMTRGEISGLAGAQDDPRHFQISVPVQPGNSGGALVSANGTVLGIIEAKLSARLALNTSGALPENVNYALKSSYALPLLESIPDAAGKFLEPSARPKPLADIIAQAEDASVLVVTY